MYYLLTGQHAAIPTTQSESHRLYLCKGPTRPGAGCAPVPFNICVVVYTQANAAQDTEVHRHWPYPDCPIKRRVRHSKNQAGAERRSTDRCTDVAEDVIQHLVSGTGDGCGDLFQCQRTDANPQTRTPVQTTPVKYSDFSNRHYNSLYRFLFFFFVFVFSHTNARTRK